LVSNKGTLCILQESLALILPVSEHAMPHYEVVAASILQA